MKLRLPVPKIAFALAFALGLSTFGCTPAAKAQNQGAVGIYFNPIVSRISNSVADTGPFAFLGNGNTSGIFGGVDFGGYYNLSHMNGFDIGVDARDSIEHGNNAKLNTFLLGPRVSFQPVAYGIRPYVQVGIGEGRSTSPYSPVSATKLAFAGSVGLDKRLNRHVDFRVVEIGYGSVTTANSSLHGGTMSVPAATVLNFSTGFVFRLP